MTQAMGRGVQDEDIAKCAAQNARRTARHVPAKDECRSFCEHCQGSRIFVEDGQYVCGSCYTVQSRVIDNGAEWRYYGAEDSRDDDPNRCGMATNPLLPRSSLGSVIGGRRNDNLDMRRIRRFQMWNSMPYWERQLLKMFDEITANTQNHGIPNKVVDDAKVMYKQVSDLKISRGENKEGLLASCIFYACIQNKTPRAAKEIARMFRIDTMVLTKGNARFQNLLKINVDCSNPDEYICRFASRLNMNYTDIQACRRLTHLMDAMEIVSENAPTSVAAGALYYYSQRAKLELTKKQIAEECEVSEVTITKCFKRLSKYKDLIEKEFERTEGVPIKLSECGNLLCA